MRMAEISRSTRDPQISVADRPDGRGALEIWGLFDVRSRTEKWVSDASHRLEPSKPPAIYEHVVRQRASSPGARANRVDSKE